MATYRNNYVSIFVHDKAGRPFDVRQLEVTFPPMSARNCSENQFDVHNPHPYLITSEPANHTDHLNSLMTEVEPDDDESRREPPAHDPVQSNEIRILLHAGRHEKKHVAIDYMNQGHIDPTMSDPNPEHKHDDANWPDGDISLTGSALRSGSISAKGDHEAPHKLNFYFPVTIKTRGGFVLNLLLAQSGPASGLLKRLYHVGKAAVHCVKAGVQYYEGDEEEALQNTRKFEKDLKTIAKENHNLWYVTVKGDQDWPAVAVDKYSFLSKVTKGRVVKNSILYTGPVGTANPPAKIQSARFYYYSENPPQRHHYYTFNLVLYDELDFTGRILEENTDTEILFLDEPKGGLCNLYSHHLDQPDKHLVAERVPSMYSEGQSRRPNVFADGDVCCYFSESSSDKELNYKMVVCSIGGNFGARVFDYVRAKPVIHKGKVYFSQHENYANKPMGVYCFDPLSGVVVLLVESFPTAQTGTRRPTRLAMRPGSDDLYFLAPGGKSQKEQTWQKQGHHLHRYDTVHKVHEVIQNPWTQQPQPPGGDVGGLDDTQFVFCRDYVYYSDRTHLWRRRADGTGEAQQITHELNDTISSGGGDHRICASPGGDYVFYTGWWDGSIFKVSTNDPNPTPTKIGSRHGDIQAVSDRLIFLSSGRPDTDGKGTAIDFDGNPFDHLRGVSSSTPGEGDLRKVSFEPVRDVFVLGDELFGTLGKSGNQHVVRGEIPKEVQEEARINFSFIGDGYRVVSASRRIRHSS